jgi:L-asparaginase II
VWRGPRVESTHDVAACACTPDGQVRYARGTIDVPVFLRSTAKPFIAAAVVLSGAAERFGFAPEEIALIAASHNGEPAHVAGVEAMLAKIGASPSDLQCGLQPGRDGVLANNCSGKHAGILALARALDAPFDSYLERDHPAEQVILRACERAFGERFDEEHIGIDGCGIPVVAVTLRAAATAFARFATGDWPDERDGAALGVVRDAMVAHPWQVAGTDRFDTDAIALGGGDVVSKSGAEGVQGIGFASRRLGVVLKVVDGARRAADPATIAILDELDVLAPEHRAELGRYARAPLTNVAGTVVGEIAAR